MVPRTECHLLNNVLPAAREYEAAELALSEAYALSRNRALCRDEAQCAIRKAGELAIAIDGLTDRRAEEVSLSKKAIRSAVDLECGFADPPVLRPCLDRIRAIANAYKHGQLNDPTLPIDNEDAIVAVGSGYGIDGYGVGKYGGPEVLINLRNGQTRKFLGDAPAAILGWVKYLRKQGANLAGHPTTLFGLTFNI